MLKWIRLIDFKSFVDEAVEVAPLTLLVGANAAGKSNFLDALWFLHGLTQGPDLDEVLNGEESARRNGDAWPGLRGGSGEISRLGISRFEIRTVWSDLWEETDAPDVRYGITCRTSPLPRLEAEFCQEGTNGEWRNLLAEPSFLSVFHRLGSDSPWPLLKIWPTLQQMQLLTMRAERMRGYGQLKRHHLGADGSNFSGALHHLCQDVEERRTLVDWLTELLAPEIVDIDFIKVEELGDVMAIFIEKDGTRISARSLSDGTLRFLGLLLNLRQAYRASKANPRISHTLLIEEIDSGLHPARIHVLMEFLREITQDRRVQIIATTHAPTCLESLDEDALRSTIVFGRVPDHEGAVVRRLGDLPHFGEVLRRTGISELFTTGWLEMAL